MHWLSGIKLKHCRYDNKQRKHQMREVNTKQHKKQTRKINKFELPFILVMMTGSLILVLYKKMGSTIPVLYDLNKFSSLLLSKILQAKSVKSRPLRSVQNQFEHPNDSLQWIILLFSYIKCFLWNNVKPSRVLQAYFKNLSDSVRCCEKFWSLGRCFDKHKPTFYLVEQCRVTIWPCP